MAPTVRGTSVIQSSASAVTNTEPGSTAIGDLQLMICETDGAQTPTCAGWSEAPGSPQTADAGVATDTKLTVLYRVRGTTAGNLTTNDPGDHIITRIISIVAGTYDPINPFTAFGAGAELTADTSASIPGAVTNVADCLVLLFMATGFDVAANSTAEFSGLTNANLTSLTEQIDNGRPGGNGGCVFVGSGVFAGPGDYGASAVTLANAAFKGMISLAIAPPHAGAITGRAGLKELAFLLLGPGGLRKMQRGPRGGTAEEAPADTGFLPRILHHI